MSTKLYHDYKELVKDIRPQREEQKGESLSPLLEDTLKAIQKELIKQDKYIERGGDKGLFEYPISGEIRTRCIFHNPDTHPSLHLNPYLGTYFCFGCKEKGSFTTLLKHLNVPIKKGRPKKNPLFGKVIKYLQNRLMVANEDGIFEFIHTFDIKPGKYKSLEGLYLYPFEDGKDYIFKPLGKREDIPKYIYPQGLKRDQLGFLKHIKKMAGESLSLAILTEGPFDALTWLSFYIPAVFIGGTLPGSKKKGKMFEALEKELKTLGAYKVFLNFDNDPAGITFTKDLIKYFLRETSLIPYVIPIPKGYKDINEALQGMGREKFEELVINEFKVNYQKGRDFKYSGIVWLFEQEWGEYLLKDKRERQIALNSIAIEFTRIKGFGEKINILKDETLNWLKRKYDIELDGIEEEIEKLSNERAEIIGKEEVSKILEELQTKLPLMSLDDVFTFWREKTKKLIQVDYPPIGMTLEEEVASIFERFFEKPDIITPILKTIGDDVGIKGKDLILIAGPTGNGKTTFALNLMKEFIEQGIKTWYFTYEISKEDIFLYLTQIFRDENLDNYLRKDLINIKDPNKKMQLEKQLNLDFKQRIEEIKEKGVKTLTPYYRKVFNVLVGTPLNSLIEEVLYAKPRIFIVDYDQIVPFKKSLYGNYERELSDLVNTLKDLAVETNSICILLSQVNKEGGARWSQTKEHASSLYLYIEKGEGAEDGFIKVYVKKNRYGKPHPTTPIALPINWGTKVITPERIEIVEPSKTTIGGNVSNDKIVSKKEIKDTLGFNPDEIEDNPLRG